MLRLAIFLLVPLVANAQTITINVLPQPKESTRPPTYIREAPPTYIREPEVRYVREAPEIRYVREAPPVTYIREAPPIYREAPSVIYSQVPVYTGQMVATLPVKFVKGVPVQGNVKSYQTHALGGSTEVYEDGTRVRRGPFGRVIRVD